MWTREGEKDDMREVKNQSNAELMEYLRKRQLLSGLRPDAFASALGIPSSSYRGWLNNPKIIPDTVTLKKIADALAEYEAIRKSKDTGKPFVAPSEDDKNRIWHELLGMLEITTERVSV